MAEDPQVVAHTISRTAASALGTPLVPIIIDSTNKFAAASAGGNSDGTLVGSGTAAGDTLSAEISGAGARAVRASGNCTAGQNAAVGVSGYQNATGGDVVVGRFLSTTTTVGDTVLMLPYEASQSRQNAAIAAVAADGAVAIPSENTTYFITKAGVAAMTIVDPTSGAHDGLTLTFIAATANAHTLSNAAGSGFNAAGAASDVGTFGGAKGDGFAITAYQGKWYVRPGQNKNVTIA